MSYSSRYLIFSVIAFSCLLQAGCSSDNKTLFTKMDPGKTGIDFKNENVETEKSNILTYEYYYNGGGVALGDINNDGLTDIYFTSTLFKNKLYLNKGNFEFEDISESSGTSCQLGWKTGVSMIDINADGFLDLYVCRSASPDLQRRKNVLLVNNKNNTFTDRAQEYGLDDGSYATQAAFFDFDHDNDLDAFLLNHSLLDISNSFSINLRNITTRYPNVGNRFLKNENGKFIDVSDSVGVFGPASNYGLGISLSDINNDGWVDVYSGCDYTGQDRLLQNRQGLYFDDITSNLSHISKFTMGTDIADFNNDGWMDIFSVDMLPEGNERQKQLFGSDRYEIYRGMVRSGLHHQYMRNMLHMNMGNGSFAEIGQLAGIANTDWSWASLFADFDNDGIQDLFVSNGFKRDLTDNDFAKFKAFEEIKASQHAGKPVSYLQVISKFRENKISNYIFRGNLNLSFTNVSRAWGLDEISLTNGAAYGDLDNDGDLDLVTNNINDVAGIYRNNSRELSNNNYLEVRLKGAGSNSHAVGAKVMVYCGDQVRVRENLPVRGFQSSVDPVLHFGLGKYSYADSIIVHWSDGKSQHLKNIKANQLLTITTDQNASKKTAIRSDAASFVRLPDLPVKHIENEFVDFHIQPLLPRMYSQEGPAFALADVNNDGYEDLFCGGAKGQESILLSAKHDGTFSVEKQQALIEIQQETIDAIFFDADNDSDQDLYIVTGGYEYQPGDPLLRDHLLLNDGKGKFRNGVLPEIFVNGSCVTAGDVDQDGDTDLFVGSKMTHGKFPEASPSYLLVNNGKGEFKRDALTPFSNLGMVSDACWTDLNNDSFPDLVVVGEWMPISVFINYKGKLVDESSTWVQEASTGLWNCLIVHDFDSDGDKDFVFGNYGMNSQLRASATEPVNLVYADFDNNGSVDPIMSYFIQGKPYPYATRDELTEQLPAFRKRFTDYQSYSKAQLEDIFTTVELKQAKKISVSQLQTCFAENRNGQLHLRPMPREMQIAPIMSLALMDVNNDSTLDLITGGNISATRARTGKITGNVGFVFTSDGKGNFQFLRPAKSGINISGDVRKIIADNSKLFYSINNAAPVIYQKLPLVK